MDTTLTTDEAAALYSTATQIGHNNPPPTPFEEVEKRINDLYDEAVQWLDGEKVTTQEMADGINHLISEISKAAKDAETLRKEEVKPFDDGKAEVQARYNPLIGSTKTVKGKAILATETAKEALTPWLVFLDAEKRAEEQRKREEADRAREAAEAAFKASPADDLAARAEAERLAADFKKAEAIANRAAKDTATSKGGTGRATGLRTTYRAEITNHTEFARYLWTHRRAEMDEFLAGEAKRLVDQNHDREIPGVIIHTERKAV